MRECIARFKDRQAGIKLKYEKRAEKKETAEETQRAIEELRKQVRSMAEERQRLQGEVEALRAKVNCGGGGKANNGT